MKKLLLVFLATLCCYLNGTAQVIYIDGVNQVSPSCGTLTATLIYHGATPTKVKWYQAFINSEWGGDTLMNILNDGNTMATLASPFYLSAVLQPKSLIDSGLTTTKLLPGHFYTAVAQHIDKGPQFMYGFFTASPLLLTVTQTLIPCRKDSVKLKYKILNGQAPYNAEVYSYRYGNSNSVDTAKINNITADSLSILGGCWDRVHIVVKDARGCITSQVQAQPYHLGGDILVGQGLITGQNYGWYSGIVPCADTNFVEVTEDEISHTIVWWKFDDNGRKINLGTGKRLKRINSLETYYCRVANKTTGCAEHRQTYFEGLNKAYIEKAPTKADDSTATVTVKYPGVATPLSVVWDDGNTSLTRQLPYGTFRAKVASASGCTQSVKIVIDRGDSLTNLYARPKQYTVTRFQL